MTIVSRLCCTLAIVGLTLTQMGAAPTTATDAIPKKDTKHRISFRTIKAAAAHIHSEQEAAEMEKTLKQLGCETKRSSHDGHIDLSYECKFWKTISLKDKAEVDQWTKWLKSKGFTTVNNTPGKEMKETVQYHLKDWKTLHFNNPISATAHVEMFKMLGCEVNVAKHNGHDDVKVRCAATQNLGLANHAEAHAWMGVLQKLGFTTLHEH